MGRTHARASYVVAPSREAHPSFYGCDILCNGRLGKRGFEFSPDSPAVLCEHPFLRVCIHIYIYIPTHIRSTNGARISATLFVL